MTAPSKIADPMELPEEVRDALERLILGLADAKRVLGIRYSEWVLGAPSLEAGISAASMCQDEWGHARLLYAMLKRLGRDPVVVEHDRPAEAYASPSTLDASADDWAELVAMIALTDGAITAVLEGFAEGSLELAANRVPKMLAEERFHSDMGRAWVHSLCKASDESAGERLRESATAILPGLLAWIDPQDPASQLLVDSGLMRAGDQVRERFLAVCGPLFEAMGIDATQVAADRSGWDTARGRGPGCPDGETIERARGDRNRMLFVE